VRNSFHGGLVFGVDAVGVGEALSHAGGDDGETGPVEGAVDGGQLGDDVLAVAALPDEADDTADLPLRAAQAVDDRGHVVGVEGDHGCLLRGPGGRGGWSSAAGWGDRLVGVERSVAGRVQAVQGFGEPGARFVRYVAQGVVVGDRDQDGGVHVRFPQDRGGFRYAASGWRAAVVSNVTGDIIAAAL